MPTVYHAIRSIKALFSTIIKPILCSVGGRIDSFLCCFERFLLPGNLFRNQRTASFAIAAPTTVIMGLASSTMKLSFQCVGSTGFGIQRERWMLFTGQRVASFFFN